MINTKEFALYVSYCMKLGLEPYNTKNYTNFVKSYHAFKDAEKELNENETK